MLKIQDDMNSYLAFSHYIDWNEPSVQRKAKELKDSTECEIELAKATYYFVDVYKRQSSCNFGP